MAKKMLINPLLKKDILVNARNPKMVIAVTLINTLFAVIAAFTFFMTYGQGYQSYYTYIVRMFPILAGCELGIISLVLPVMTSTSISGEKERGTLDIMLTTPVRSGTIVMGKLASAIITTFMYVIATLPFLAVSCVVGGLEWRTLLEFVGIVLYMDIYIGSIGMFYSSVRRTSVSAAISTIIFIFAVVLGTFLLAIVLNSAAYKTESIDVYNSYQAVAYTCYAINPVIWIVEYANQVFYAISLLPSVEQSGGYTLFLAEHLQWISVVFNMCIAVMGLVAASARLRSGERTGKKKSKTIQNGI